MLVRRAFLFQTAESSWRAPTTNKQAIDLDFTYTERARHASWSTGLSTNRLFGPTPAPHCTKTFFRHMHLGPEAGVNTPHGATRKLIDTNLSVLLLLVSQLERFGASTPGDGGCFDFRMGVQFIFPDLHTRRHNHLHRCYNDGVLTDSLHFIREAATSHDKKGFILGLLSCPKTKDLFDT